MPESAETAMTRTTANRIARDLLAGRCVCLYGPSARADLQRAASIARRYERRYARRVYRRVRFFRTTRPRHSHA